MHTKARNIPAHPFWSIRPLHFSITFTFLKHPSVYFPVFISTKSCCQQLLCQQLEAVVSTGKINHSRSCFSPLYFGDGPLILLSHKYRITEKGHSPTHQQVSTETGHSSYSLLSGCSWKYPEKVVQVVTTSWQYHSDGPYTGHEILAEHPYPYQPLLICVSQEKHLKFLRFSPSTQTLHKQSGFSLIWG